MIQQWIEDAINGVGGWKSFETYEVVASEDRDVAIAEWIIRCLANPQLEGSAEVLAAIIERREQVKNG